MSATCTWEDCTRHCDWCGSDGRIIGENYSGSDWAAVVYKCNDCHHEWSAVVCKTCGETRCVYKEGCQR